MKDLDHLQATSASKQGAPPPPIERPSTFAFGDLCSLAPQAFDRVFKTLESSSEHWKGPGWENALFAL